MSITELLVAIIIIGVATAGITELTWFNAAWSIHALNKMDNVYAAREFLSRIGRDIRTANSIDSSSTPNTLVLTCPGMDSDGFPTTPLTTITYSVVADTSTADGGSYQIQVQDGAGTTPLVVLRGIVGPTAQSGSYASTFQYTNSSAPTNDPTFGVIQLGSATTSVASTGDPIGSVIINLELRRQDFGQTNGTSANSKASLEGLRAEFAPRNTMVVAQ